MIYVYFGHDYQIVIQKAHTLLSSLSKKKPEASIFYINNELFEEGMWTRALASQGLFVESLLVFGSRVLEQKEHREYFEKNIKEIAKSKNIFIFAEENINTPLLKKLEKYAEKIVTLSSIRKETAQKEKFNLFTLTDAFGSRNFNTFFIEYEKALLNGAHAEEIHPLLFWQIKSILSVKALGTDSKKKPEDIGMKDYPFKKAQQFSKNYTLDELKILSNKFTKLFHEARFGEADLELGILGAFLSIKN